MGEIKMMEMSTYMDALNDEYIYVYMYIVQSDDPTGWE